MKKLFKFIFKLILFIILLAVIIVAVILFILHDSKKTTFVPSETAISAEVVLGDGIDESVKRIAKIENNSRSTSTDNYMGVSLTIDDMNNILVDYIRKNMNPNYLKEGDKDGIISASGLTLESLLFEELDGKIGVKARLTAFGFYRSSVLLSGDIKLEGKVLKIEFEDAKLGNKLKISRKFVLNIFNKLNLSFNGSKNFDVNTLTLSLDISDMLNSYTNSNKFTSFFTGCPYSMDYVKATDDALGNIALKIDTKKIFTPVDTTRQKASSSYTLATPVVDGLGYSAVIAEGDFNYLISQSFTTIESPDSINLGNKKFTLTLSDLYYNLDKDEILATMYINELATDVVAKVTFTTVKDVNDNVSELVFKVSTLTLGNTIVSAEDFFNEVRVPSSTLTPDPMFVVKDFEVDKTNENCKITYALA